MSQLSMGFDPPRRPRVLGVAEVVRAADRLLAQRLANLWIEGEVSGYRVASGGHAFFALKDDEAVLPVAMFGSTLRRLGFSIVDGQVLRVFGRLGIYDKQGRFQLYAEAAEPVGLGAMMLRLREIQDRLRADGLLDPARKRQLPTWPRAIGVVTSRDGAAIHDVVEVAARRCPCRILLVPALVQGPDAPRSLMRALRRVAAVAEVDVVVLGRGGGSLEDLWAFNDEALARAVAAHPVPVVSAVGHETDVTLCDLVADVRAATPSHAAQLVVPDRVALLGRLDHLGARIRRALARKLVDERGRLERQVHRLSLGSSGPILAARRRLDQLRTRLGEQHPRVRLQRARVRLLRIDARLRAAATVLVPPRRARLQRLGSALAAAGQASPARLRRRLAHATAKLDALSPLSVLARGYAVATAEGRALIDVGAVHVGDIVDVRLHLGSLQARIERILGREREPEE